MKTYTFFLDILLVVDHLPILPCQLYLIPPRLLSDHIPVVSVSYHNLCVSCVHARIWELLAEADTWIGIFKLLLVLLLRWIAIILMHRSFYWNVNAYLLVTILLLRGRLQVECLGRWVWAWSLLLHRSLLLRIVVDTFRTILARAAWGAGKGLHLEYILHIVSCGDLTEFLRCKGIL